jgi:hypothetical protein
MVSPLIDFFLIFFKLFFCLFFIFERIVQDIKKNESICFPKKKKNLSVEKKTKRMKVYVFQDIKETNLPLLREHSGEHEKVSGMIHPETNFPLLREHSGEHEKVSRMTHPETNLRL